MTPERHARVKEVFLAVCEVERDRRAAFLDEACGGDADLRREVEALLSHHSEAGAAKASVDSSSGTTVPVHRLNAAPQRRAGAEPPPGEPPRNFPPGKVLGDRYRIVCMLGKGGMGEVYRAEDLVVGQNVALKFLPAALPDKPKWLGRMRNEVRLARRVTHPHVCRVYDLDEVDGDAFISMEYVEGEDLRNLLGRIGRLPGEKAIQLAREISLGLAAAHARGIVHRDLKPANVMIDGLGHARIMDFGLAAVHDQIQGAEIRAGTPEYMSPEQLSGREVTPQSDIYALGLLVCELITGESAFRARTMKEYAQLKEDLPRPPSSMVEGIDPEIERVILRCLEPNPADRPASARVLAACFGGNSLSAAVDAGETLPPEIVAAAEDLQDIHPAAATGRLAAFVSLLLLLLLLSPHAHPVQRLGETRSPEVLASEAYDIAGQPEGQRQNETYGFRALAGRPVDETGLPLDRLAAMRRDGESLVFWYRSSTEDLLSEDPMQVVFGSARAGPLDPPDIQPGDCRIILDADGRLLSFEQNPPDSDNASSPDQWFQWNTLLRRAKIDLERFRAVEPQLDLDLHYEKRQAWVGFGPDSRPIRVEAAFEHQRPVFFAVLEDQYAPEVGFGSIAWREWLTKHVQLGVVSLLAIISVPLARKSLRRGRSDPRGALRLASFVFGLRLAGWLLQAAHSSRLSVEWNLSVLVLAGAMGEAFVIWLLYVALEPYARKYWPQTLISWTRTLRGQVADPRVGRDVLAGCALGALLSVTFSLDIILSTRIGAGSRPAVRVNNFFDILLGLRMTWGFYFDALRNSIYMGLAFMLLIVLLRTLLKSTAGAAALAVVVISAIFIPRGANQWLSPVLIGLVSGGVCVWAFVRLGLVPIIVAFFVTTVLYRTPLTWNTRAWYGELSLMELVLLMGLAGTGFMLARRKPAFARIALVS